MKFNVLYTIVNSDLSYVSKVHSRSLDHDYSVKYIFREKGKEL